LLVVGCAASPSVPNDPDVDKAAAQLQRQSDADSLAAAALLRVTRNRSESIALLARAVAAAPTRADLVWLSIRVCHEQPSCDPTPEELKLRMLSPANGAGWLGQLSRAAAAHDEPARDAALTAIAHTERIDIYWNTLVGHLSMAAVRKGRMPPAQAMLTVIGIVGAIGVPAYMPLSHSCTVDRLQRDEIREACQGVARALENGDAVITEMMGVALAKRIWPEGSPEWESADERRRVFEYRKELWKPLEPRTWSAAQAQRFIALCLDQPREQDVARMQLIEAGQEPDPPKL